MSSWNPSLTIGGTIWSGSPNLVTRNQLLSSIIGIEDTFSASTISTFQTLRATEWMSTPVLYVSDIQGATIDISGIQINQNGVFNAPLVSLSSMNMKGFDLGLDVSFDFGLGKAIGGIAAGLGGLVGGGLIAVGTGAGLAIQGAEQGIATMVAGRPQNFISQTNYETINFTSQLQISTLGDAYPAYSTIFRTVSSVAANQVPGPEIFTSSIFYPGQICIRSVSDPFNLITADSNLNTSTIQSFGQWTPFTGLEPENIVANSISTYKLSTNSLFASLAETDALTSFTVATSNLGVGTQANFNFNAAAVFDLGSSGDALIVGDINQWNFQTNQPIVFSQIGDPGILTPGAILTLGTGAESILQISSISALGNIQANSGFISSLVVNDLLVLSTFSTVFNITAYDILSTSIVTASLVSTLNLQAKYIAPFTFSSILGNPIGPFDINKYDNVISTTYDQISSLTQNIMNYSLTAQVQDEALFDIGDQPLGETYKVTPQNVNQWGSTIIQYSGFQGAGAVDFGWVGQWAVSPGQTQGVNLPQGATLDIFVNPNNSVGATGNFFIQQESNNAYPAGVSTFFQIPNYDPGQGNSNQYKFRATLPPVVGGIRSGWWELSNGFTPYTTSNNNTFQIYQDINDTYISATDRLHLQAGDIRFDGSVSFSNFNINNINASNITTSNFFNSLAIQSTIQATNINTSTIIANPTFSNGAFNSFYYKSTISYNDPPQQVTAFTGTFKNDSPDFIPVFNLIPNFMGNNYFTSYNYTNWNNTLWNNNSVSAFQPNIFVGDIQQTLGTYSAFFYINNTIVGTSYSLPVYYINSAGSNLLGNIAGNTYGKIATNDGINWTLTTVANPSASGGSYNNTLQVTQGTSYTGITESQNLQIQAPNTTITTGTLGIYADQIRVNSRRYGTAPSAGLNSFPIGFQTGTYVDGNISWTQNPPASGIWQSDATNVIYGLAGIFFDYNSYRAIIIPSRFRTNTYPIYSWDVQVAPIAIPGGGYAWGYNRYIQIAAGPSGPGINTTNNWNEWLMIPINYCTN